MNKTWHPVRAILRGRQMPYEETALKSHLPGVEIAPSLADAVNSPAAGDNLDLQSVQPETAAKRYDIALTELRTLPLKHPRPDLSGLMGFALRKAFDHQGAP